MTLALLGNARDSGRAVFITAADRIEDLPQRISVPCSRFVLLLAYEHGDTPAHLADTLGKLLDAGCVYLCAWGPGCEHVHDTMDDIVLERELEGGPEQTIMTTWHANELLADTVDFTLQWARPDDALAQGCDAIVLAAVGNPVWATELRNAAQQYLSPPVL